MPCDCVARFDTELSKAQEEAKSERVQKEKLQRERDTLAADKFGLEKQVEVWTWQYSLLINLTVHSTSFHYYTPVSKSSYVVLLRGCSNFSLVGKKC